MLSTGLGCYNFTKEEMQIHWYYKVDAATWFQSISYSSSSIRISAEIFSDLRHFFARLRIGLDTSFVRRNQKQI